MISKRYVATIVFGVINIVNSIIHADQPTNIPPQSISHIQEPIDLTTKNGFMKAMETAKTGAHQATAQALEALKNFADKFAGQVKAVQLFTLAPHFIKKTVRDELKVIFEKFKTSPNIQGKEKLDGISELLDPNIKFALQSLEKAAESLNSLK